MHLMIVVGPAPFLRCLLGETFPILDFGFCPSRFVDLRYIYFYWKGIYREEERHIARSFVR